MSVCGAHEASITTVKKTRLDVLLFSAPVQPLHDRRQLVTDRCEMACMRCII